MKYNCLFYVLALFGTIQKTKPLSKAALASIFVGSASLLRYNQCIIEYILNKVFEKHILNANTLKEKFSEYTSSVTKDLICMHDTENDIIQSHYTFIYNILDVMSYIGGANNRPYTVQCKDGDCILYSELSEKNIDKNPSEAADFLYSQKHLFISNKKISLNAIQHAEICDYLKNIGALENNDKLVKELNNDKNIHPMHIILIINKSYSLSCAHYKELLAFLDEKYAEWFKENLKEYSDRYDNLKKSNQYKQNLIVKTREKIISAVNENILPSMVIFTKQMYDRYFPEEQAGSILTTEYFFKKNKKMYVANYSIENILEQLKREIVFKSDFQFDTKTIEELALLSKKEKKITSVLSKIFWIDQKAYFNGIYGIIPFVMTCFAGYKNKTFLISKGRIIFKNLLQKY